MCQTWHYTNYEDVIPMFDNEFSHHKPRRKTGEGWGCGSVVVAIALFAALTVGLVLS